MKDNDQNQENDEIVEISDLPYENASKEKKPFAVPGTRRLLTLLRWSRRHRRISVLFTVSLVSLVLLLLLGSILPLQQLRQGKGIGSTPPTPTPTPTSLSGPNLFYFSPLPSWGTVLLDGHPLSRVPVPVVRNEPPIRLPAGRHLLEWRAAPFEPQRCTLLVPSYQSGAQTCRVTRAPWTPFADHASLVTIPVSLAQLPSQERTALVQAAQSLLDTLQSTETVQPGEHYTLAENQDLVQTAVVSLQAHLRLVLDTTMSVPVTCPGLRLGEGCTIAGQDCRLFCTPLWPKTPGAAWDIAALFHPTWQYTTRDGTPVPSPPHVASHPQQEDQFVMLHVTWQPAHWQVAFENRDLSSFDDPVCIATIGEVGANPSYYSLPGNTMPLRWAYTSAPKAAVGCLAITQIKSSVSHPSVRTGDALLLRRFGVLLAANPTAHQIWPKLPVADSYEQQLAQDLARRTVW